MGFPLKSPILGGHSIYAGKENCKQFMAMERHSQFQINHQKGSVYQNWEWETHQFGITLGSPPLKDSPPLLHKLTTTSIEFLISSVKIPTNGIVEKLPLFDSLIARKILNIHLSSTQPQGKHIQVPNGSRIFSTKFACHSEHNPTLDSSSPLIKRDWNLIWNAKYVLDLTNVVENSLD